MISSSFILTFTACSHQVKKILPFEGPFTLGVAIEEEQVPQWRVFELLLQRCCYTAFLYKEMFQVLMLVKMSYNVNYIYLLFRTLGNRNQNRIYFFCKKKKLFWILKNAPRSFDIVGLQFTASLVER